MVSLRVFVFELGARTGRTDRRTDGRTDGQTGGRTGKTRNGAYKGVCIISIPYR